jgi:hypothetical protein
MAHIRIGIGLPNQVRDVNPHRDTAVGRPSEPDSQGSHGFGPAARGVAQDTDKLGIRYSRRVDSERIEA